MPTLDEIKAFLEKRGYKADVSQIGENSWHISLRAKSTDDVVATFANISQEGKFVVSLELKDAAELLLGSLPQQITDLNTNLALTLKATAKDIHILQDRIKKEEKRPWWRKW